MMNRKAQLSIFLVIALVIVAAVILLSILYTRGLILPLGEEESKQVLGSQAEPLRSLVSECIEAATADALSFASEHGGYASYQQQGLTSIDFAGEKVVVLSRTDQGFVNRLPSKEEFERQIAAYLNEGAGAGEIDSCLDNFASFERQGFRISPKKRTLSVDVSSESVNVQVDWKIDLGKGRANLPVDARDVIMLAEAEQALRIATDIVNKEASGIEFEGLEYDKYVASRSLALRDFEIKSQNYPSSEQKIFWITTLPKDPREKAFTFTFAVDRSVSI